MDSKELRGLYEAYSEVYAPQQIDEGLRTKIGDKVKKHVNQYAYQQGIHNNPGWLRKPEKREALNKAVIDDIKKNPKAVVKYAAKQVKRKVTGVEEEFDIFDVVLEFLQAEGFAETLEEAEWMMANVIDEEAIEIVVGEGYQRNPEKGEKENKKYAPVRGEKTPMPPRGDKRREDFEKWYAKQMGR